MPKDNEVDEKVMPVAYTGQDELDAIAAGFSTACTFGTYSELQDRTVPLYSAATVAELRAEVERLRSINSSLVDKCNRLNLCGAQSDQRADAAERRVAKLTGLLSDTAGNLRRMANDEFAECDQVRLEHVVNRIADALTGADPT